MLTRSTTMVNIVNSMYQHKICLYTLSFEQVRILMQSAESTAKPLAWLMVI